MVRLTTVHRVVITSALGVCLGVAAFGLSRPEGPARGDWQALGVMGLSVAVLLGAYLVWFIARHRHGAPDGHRGGGGRPGPGSPAPAAARRSGGATPGAGTGR